MVYQTECRHYVESKKEKLRRAGHSPYGKLNPKNVHQRNPVARSIDSEIARMSRYGRRI